MSGLAVIYHGDRRPVDPAALARMTAALAHRGGDGGREWIEAAVGLGQRLQFTTPESLAELEPAPVLVPGCRIVWDGRIDNRGELLAALGGGAGSSRPPTDPELLLLAYRRWGTACLAHCLGDFAFALWDGGRARLFCGRDRLGLKPFYYTWDGATLLASSEARPLAVARGGGMPEPDDELVLAYLVGEFREDDHARSFFQGIRRLPPGHALVAEGRTLRVERYWTVDPDREIAYASDEEYVDHFRALFAEAVRCRLRSYFPVGLFLSGGLDSAAIAVLAGGCAGPGGDPVPPVEAFTIYGGDRRSDEREHARRAAAAAGLKAHELDAGERAPLEGLDDIREMESPTVGVGRARDTDNMDAIRGRDCRVVLSGEGGDQVLDEVGYLADLLAGARPLRFWRESRAFADWYGADWPGLAATVAKCVVPAAGKYWGKRLLRRVPPGWVNRDTARSVDLRRRVRAPRVARRFRSFAQAETYAQVTSPYYLLRLEVDERYCARFGIEMRYPFLDSRLIEFVLAVPSFRRTRGGERKRLLRTAMRDAVPDAIQRRRGKGDWTDSMDRALLRLCAGAPPVPLRNASGRMTRYVDLAGAARLVERYRNGDRGLRWEVWSLVTLDYWLMRTWGRS